MSKPHPLVEVAIEAFPTLEESGPVISLNDVMRSAVLAVLRELRGYSTASSWPPSMDEKLRLDAIIREIEG